jgi:hypothetical protein
VPEPGHPRFNHVALSVPADLLSEASRRDIVAFYSEVFGWKELPTETIDRERLILSAYSYDQFVFLTAADRPMEAPRTDHFGMGVATIDELDAFYANAIAYRKRDSRVDIVNKQVEQYPGVVLTSFYVGFLLPLMIEVQHFAFG